MNLLPGLLKIHIRGLSLTLMSVSASDHADRVQKNSHNERALLSTHYIMLKLMGKETLTILCSKIRFFF